MLLLIAAGYANPLPPVTVHVEVLPTLTPARLQSHRGERSPIVDVLTLPSGRYVLTDDGRILPVDDAGASSVLTDSELLVAIQDVQDSLDNWEPAPGSDPTLPVAVDPDFRTWIEVQELDFVDIAPEMLEWLDAYGDMGRYDVEIVNVDAIVQDAQLLVLLSTVSTWDPSAHGCYNEVGIEGGDHTFRVYEDGTVEIGHYDWFGFWHHDDSMDSEGNKEDHDDGGGIGGWGIWPWNWDGCVMKPWQRWITAPATPLEDFAASIVVSSDVVDLVDQRELGTLDQQSFQQLTQARVDAVLAQGGGAWLDIRILP